MSQSCPKIALVGRPNVGKSALFNCICKRRIAIVDAAEGVTRDRLYGEASLFSQPFTIIDTGGLRAEREDQFQKDIQKQTQEAIDEADGIILVVDGQVGLTEYDHVVAKLLHRTNKPVVLAVNKWDQKHEEEDYSFLALGISDYTFVSAAHNTQIAELLENMLSQFQTEEAVEEEEADAAHSPKIAFIGRTNVGKSTITNALLQSERCLVSEVAGTTRDALYTEVLLDGQPYCLVDTAGIRHKNVEASSVEKFAAMRTKQAIEEVDLCLLMIDAREGLTSHEKRIALRITKAKKPCIVLVNKWDLVKNFRMEHCVQELHRSFPFFRHCPVLCLSAKTGRGLEKIIPEVEKVLSEGRLKIPTSELNDYFQSLLEKVPPPRVDGKRFRIYYTTQIAKSPPAFVLFVNHPRLLPHSYQTYLINGLRKRFSYCGNPISLIFRKKAPEKKS